MVEITFMCGEFHGEL